MVRGHDKRPALNRLLKDAAVVSVRLVSAGKVIRPFLTCPP